MVIICSSKYRRKRLWKRRGIALQYLLWFPTANYTFWQVMAGYDYILSYHLLTLTHTIRTMMVLLETGVLCPANTSSMFKHFQTCSSRIYRINILLSDLGISFIRHIQIRTCTLLVGLHSGFVLATNDDATAMTQKGPSSIFLPAALHVQEPMHCCTMLNLSYHNLSRVSLAAFQLKACGWISEVCTAWENGGSNINGLV